MTASDSASFDPPSAESDPPDATPLDAVHAGAEPRLDGVPADDFRQAMGRLPSGVTVVSTHIDGVLHAMTATAFASVSLHPPMVLVCVGRAARIHPVITAAGSWAVSILAPDQEELARHFASSGRDLTRQFDRVPHRVAPYSRAAWIEGASSWLDCSTEAAHRAGDHTVLIGRVRAVAVSAGPAQGLVYRRGRYLPI